MRAWIGRRDVDGGLGRESAAIEKSGDDQPAKDHPDVGQVSSVLSVVEGHDWLAPRPLSRG